MPPKKAGRSRKQQTRLKFDPVDRNSSPAAGISPAIVRYEVPGNRRTHASSCKAAADTSESDDILSSAKKDIFGTQTPSARKNGKLPFKALPTPAKSSQPPVKDGLSDVSHDSEDNDMAQKIPTSAPRRSTRNVKPVFGIKSKKRRGAPAEDDNSSGSEPEEDTIIPSKKQLQKVVETSNISSGSGCSDEDSDEDIPAVKTPNKRAQGTAVVIPSSRSTPQHVSLSDTSEDEIVNLRPRLNKSRRGGRVIGGMFSSPRSDKKRALDEEDREEKGGEGARLPPPKPNKARRGGFRSSMFSSSSGPRRSAPSSKKPGVENEEDDEDDDLFIPTPKRSQRPVFQNKNDSRDEIKPSTQRHPGPITTQDSDNEDEEEEDIVSPTKRRRAAVESDESEDIVSPAKRQRNIRQGSDSDSDVPLRRTQSKSETPARFTRQVRGRRHRTEKEKTLELLKRRRAGEDIEELTETSESGTEDEDGASDFEHLSEFEDEEEEEAPNPIRKAAKETSRGDSDEDFIVEDDDEDPLGIPSIHSIPLEFTHQAHKPLKEHFKDAVEWMIHNKINPAFARDDPVYRQAFLKLEMECTTLAKSKFSSTQWTRDFTAALYARPEFITGPLVDGEGYDPVSGQPKCDACNHRSHVPSAFIQFKGKAYDKKTLEDIDQGSDYDEDDDSDGSSARSVNSNDQAIPREKTKWFVGRFCKANAEQSHLLIHWKYALYEWVKGTLKAEGELTPDKLASREAMKAKQRTKYANAVVDQWEAEGQIKALYRDFKNQISAARELKQGARGAWK